MIESELLLLVVLKTSPWAYKIEDLNREKLVGSFYEKKKIVVDYIINELLSRTRMSC